MNVDKQTWRKVFWGSFLILLFTLFRLVFSESLPLQFVEFSAKENFETGLVLLTPLCVFVMALSDYLIHRKKRIVYVQIIIALFAAIPIFFIAVLSVAFKEHWKEEKVLFQGRFNNQEIIQLSKPFARKPRFMKATPVLPGLRWMTFADTTQLEESRWEKVLEGEADQGR